MGTQIYDAIIRAHFYFWRLRAQDQCTSYYAYRYAMLTNNNNRSISVSLAIARLCASCISAKSNRLTFRKFIGEYLCDVQSTNVLSHQRNEIGFLHHSRIGQHTSCLTFGQIILMKNMIPRAQRTRNKCLSRANKYRMSQSARAITYFMAHRHIDSIH